MGRTHDGGGCFMTNPRSAEAQRKNAGAKKRQPEQRNTVAKKHPPEQKNAAVKKRPPEQRNTATKKRLPEQRNITTQGRTPEQAGVPAKTYTAQKCLWMAVIVAYIGVLCWLTAGGYLVFEETVQNNLRFHSVWFLFLFLPVLLLIYHKVSERMQKKVLLVFSLLFYAWGQPVYMGLLLLLAAFHYFSGLDLEGKRRMSWKMDNSILLSVGFDLLLLIFCRYTGLLAETLNRFLPFQISLQLPEAPAGISVFLLLGIGYLIEVYRGKIKAEQKFLNVALYLSLFPPLAGGLFVRFQDLKETLSNRKKGAIFFGDGAMFFIRGMAKAMILAHVLGRALQEILQMKPGSFTVLTAWIGCALYALKLYYLLSGYSDMAIGVGKLLGLEFKKNFEYPYTAESLTEFSEKWYISLGTWFRENVFGPMGGEEKGTGRTVLHLAVVWALLGCWYGPSWKFLVWGLLAGLLLAAEKYVFSRVLVKIPSFFRHLYVLLLVSLGWILFFSPDLGYALRYLGMLFGIGASGFADGQSVYYLVTNWLMILLGVLGCTTAGYRLLQRITYNVRTQRVRAGTAGVVYGGLFLLSLAYLVM